MHRFAQRIIMLLMSITSAHCAMVDLTHAYQNGMLYYKYWEKPWKFDIIHRGLHLNTTYWGEWNEFETAEHGGTHMDAPVHFHQSLNDQRNPENWKLDEIPLSRLKGPGVIIDVRDKAEANQDYEVTVDDILKWEAKYGTIPKGAIVLMNSGWDKYYRERNELKYYGEDQRHSPGFAADTAEWMIENRGIYGLGADAGSFGPGVELPMIANNPDYKSTHVAILSRNVWGLENVANLGDIPAVGTTIYAMPIKIRDGSGGPCRVIAEWDTDAANADPGVKCTIQVTCLITLIGYLFIVSISSFMIRGSEMPLTYHISV